MNFFKKLKLKRLYRKRKNLLEQAYNYSTRDRKKSDSYFAKVNSLDKEINDLETNI
jgi:hypothetical protein